MPQWPDRTVSILNTPRVLAIFDLDGTISRRDTFTPFVFRWLARRPARWWRLLLVLPTALAFSLGRADRGQLKGQLLHATLGGLQRATLERWTRAHVNRLLQHGLFSTALERIRWHRDAGHYLVLMSASVDCFVPELGRELGFDETICSQVLWNADGTLDGRLAGSNCRGPEKLRQLEALQQRIPFLESWAYGNSRADLLHMQHVSHGVYVNGPPAHLPPGSEHICCERWR